MTDRPDARHAPSELTEKILSFPETHMGVQTVALVLRNGRVVEDVQIGWGREVIRVAGEDGASVDWDDVVDVLDRSQQRD